MRPGSKRIQRNLKRHSGHWRSRFVRPPKLAVPTGFQHKGSTVVRTVTDTAAELEELCDVVLGENVFSEAGSSSDSNTDDSDERS